MIADDEMMARGELQLLLSSVGDITIVGEAENAAEAVGLAVMRKPDLIFLNINMRGMSGLEAAKSIHAVAAQAAIIFVTAYDKCALRAFDLSAADYIVKPFEPEQVRKAIARFHNLYAARQPQARDNAAESRIHVRKLPVESGGKILLLNYEEILYAYAHLGNAIVVTERVEFVFNGTLADLEAHVKGTQLYRIHRSYIVNMDCVREVVPWFKGTYWLKLAHDAGIEIPVSKNQIKEVKEILGLK